MSGREQLWNDMQRGGFAQEPEEVPCALCGNPAVVWDGVLVLPWVDFGKAFDVCKDCDDALGKYWDAVFDAPFGGYPYVRPSRPAGLPG